MRSVSLPLRLAMPPWRAPAFRVLPDSVRQAHHVCFWAAGSTGRRNTGVKSLRGGFKLQGLPRPFVELTRHSVKMGLRVHIPANKSGSVRTSSFCGSTIPQWGRNGYPTGVQLEPDDGIILD